MSARVTHAVGIDVGGTFTDLAALDAQGRITTTKVLSVPDDRAVGVLNALRDSALHSDDVARIVHGTTVVTNLLLERKGARVVLCATAGFTDVLELRRQERAALYDLTAHHPDALVPANRTVAVRERIVPEGVQQALLPDAIADTVRQVLMLDPETVAIALLHAYDQPQHERLLRDALVAALRDAGRTWEVVCAHEVLPEIREYERTATTVAEAYARPVVQSYLQRLMSALNDRGFCAPQVMTSAGGTLSVSLASRHAAALALSGPAGGVAGASAIVRELHIALALTIDIGGTSADVGIIVDGEPLVERGGSVAGVPIALPRVLVEPVAAGGGSIGWIDEGGALRAGPHSAGAVPGPAAYDRGGVEATVTDAHVVLGHIPEGEWSGGVRISGERARSAIQMLATRLGVSPHRGAQALINTADATMARALRRVSVERGVDPRAATLVAFGGGGPLHACGLAELLGMTRILVPPFAGVLSAVGLALAPERRDGLASFLVPCDALDARTVTEAIAALTASLRTADGAALEARAWARARYVGQGYELEVPLVAGDDGAHIARKFAAVHEQRLGFVLERSVECVSLRMGLAGERWPVQFARVAQDGELANDVDDGRALDRTIRGPFTVRLPDATMHIKQGWTARALAIGGWMLEMSEAAAE